MDEFIFNKKSTKEKRRILRENSTPEENILWEYLRDHKLLNLKFKRQQGIGEYIADFFCFEKRVVIELDGNAHYSEDGVEYDKIRTDFMKSAGIKVIRFKNSEIRDDIDSVILKIKEFIK